MSIQCECDAFSHCASNALHDHAQYKYTAPCNYASSALHSLLPKTSRKTLQIRVSRIVRIIVITFTIRSGRMRILVRRRRRIRIITNHHKNNHKNQNQHHTKKHKKNSSNSNNTSENNRKQKNSKRTTQNDHNNANKYKNKTKQNNNKTLP